ncbi:hypothetical protein AB6D89_12205 [Vibrio splendidus]|nr:hypothetical protein BK411_04965 [Vibrio splendidus]
MEIKQTNQGKNQTVINNESGVVNIGNVQRYVDLQVPESRHDLKQISSEFQGKFIVGFVLSIAVPTLGLFADLLAIHPVFDLPFWVYVGVFSVVFIAIVSVYFDNYKIFNSDVPDAPSFSHLHNDRLVSRTENGYVVFTYSCGCIYPNCQGVIKISEPPERYNGNYHLFAKCNVGGEQHSYGLDCNLVAYPVHIDWRVREPEKNS